MSNEQMHTGECIHPGAVICERAGAHVTDHGERVSAATDLWMDQLEKTGFSARPMHEACPYTLKATPDEIAGHIVEWLYTGDSLCYPAPKAVTIPFAAVAVATFRIENGQPVLDGIGVKPSLEWAEALEVRADDGSPVMDRWFDSTLEAFNAQGTEARKWYIDRSPER